MDYKKIYKKIEKRYIIITLLLLLFFISGQIIIQNQIDHGKDMANVINISGRQRMLSQKISKNSLMIYQNPNPASLTYHIEDLEESLESFKSAHQDLINCNEATGLGIENSETIMTMFKEINPYFNKILTSGKQVVNLGRQEVVNSDQMFEEIKKINKNEKVFLEKMDEIVFQYNAEAENDILRLEQVVRIVFYLIILGIIMITLLILVPATKTLRYAFIDINESNENIIKIFQTMKGALFLVDEEGEIILNNTDAQEIMTLNEGEKKHIEKAIKYLDIDINDCIKKIRKGEKLDKVEAKIEDKHGEIRSMLITGFSGKYNQKDITLISAYDITDQKKAEEILKDKAEKDELTGLYNRHFLEGIIEGEVERSKRYQYPLSAAILDIDDFKIINDT